MSSLDCMDIDVSSHLSKFVESRRNFNEVVKQLEYYAEFNINIQYLSNFKVFRNHRGMNRMVMNPWQNKELCFTAKQIVDTRYKTDYLHV